VTAQGLEIFYKEAVSVLRYTDGTDLAAELRAEIAREQGPVRRCPAYLLDDDAKAKRTARVILDGGDSPARLARQQDQTRKGRRKNARAARRKNR
jgi:hypothetical protein